MHCISIICSSSTDPPSLQVSPLSMTVNQTDIVPLTCTVFALPRPVITWTDDRDDAVITLTDGVISIMEESLGNNTFMSVLTFLNIVKANESNYTCTAVNNVTNIIGAVDEGTSSLIVQGMFCCCCCCCYIVR